MSFKQFRDGRVSRLCDVSDDSSAYLKTSPGLAMTPADIQECVKRGVPVSTDNVSQFVDGVESASQSLSVDEMRGVDIVDTWDASLDAKSKIAKAHINDLKRYG